MKDLNSGKPNYEELLDRVAQLEKQNKHLSDQQAFIKNNAELVIWGTDTAIWDWNYITGEVVFSDKKAEMLGYDAKELNPQVYTFTKMIHPDDYANTMENMRKLLKNEIEIYEVEYRIKAKNGEWKWFYDKGKVVERDEKNKPLRIIGIVIDITEKKKAIALLKENEERFRNLFNHSADGIRIADSNGTIIEENPRMSKITGIPTNEVIGKPVWDIVFRLTSSEMQTQENFDRIKNLCDNFINTGVFPIQDKIEHQLNYLGTIKEVESTFFSVKTENGFLLYSIFREVTDFKNAQKDLLKAKTEIEESELKYRLLAENLSDVIWIIDLDFQFKYLSHSSEKLFGYSMEDRQNIQMHDLFTLDTYNKSKQILKFHLDQYYYDGNNKPILYEMEGIHKNGSSIFIEISAKFQIDANGKVTGVHGTSRDITQRKIAEMNLKKLQTAIENLKACIVITDYEGNIEYANPFFTESTGYLPEEYKGENPRIIKTDLHDSDYYQEMWDTIKSGKTWEGEFCNQKKTGILYWENAIISPIKANDNEITHFVAVKTDITEDKKINKDLQLAKSIAEENGKNLIEKNIEYEALNEELRQTNEELILAKEKAEESDNLKSSFLNNMSHEIRTPLNSIVGFSNIISQGKQPPEKLKTFSDIISKSSSKLINIISDVIEISQIHANLIKPTLDEIDIISLVGKTVSGFNETAKLKNIKLILNMDVPYKKYLILTDIEKLNKILAHIVDNALKFTYQGSVEINCGIKNEIIQISISDTGIGISEVMQSKIFEPFRQVEIGSAREYGGNGLGLAISKAYIELLNGSISLQSEPNRGTKVTISMPVNKSNKQINPEKIEKSNYSINTILIAEDEYINFLYLKELLVETNLKIIYATNGQEAVDFCNSNNEIGLVLMDIKMPIMDGIESANLIKALHPDLPIIAQTAFATESDKEKFSKCGFDDYITKPISAEIIRTTISKYMDK